MRLPLAPAQRISTFEEELNLIPNKDIRRWTEDCLLLAPDYFFEIGAADSMNHHPYWDLGPGGNVRHTRALVRVAFQLSGTAINPEFHVQELSKLIAAGILHDTCKYGMTFDYKMYEAHPYLPRVLFKDVALTSLENEKEWIFRAIEAHMGSRFSGRWSPMAHVTKQTFEEDHLAYLIHQADYLVANEDYIDPRFENVNKGIDISTLPHYEPFPDSVLRGIILGVMRDRLTEDKFIQALAEGMDNDLLKRVSALRTPYSQRRKFYNLEVILSTAELNLNNFIRSSRS